MLSLEQIQMLVFSAELGSFSACARRMGKVQSAISHGINALEIDLGVELFDRSSRKPTLTPAGERILKSAQALLAQSTEIQNLASSILAKEEAVLRIALDDGLIHPDSFEVLQKMSNAYPHVQLDIQVQTSTDIIQDVIQGQLDLGIVFSEIEALNKIDFCYIGQVEWVAVCHPSSPLASIPIETPSTLIPHRQFAARGRFKTESQQLISLTPKVWWSSSYEQILKLVMQDLGWAYLPNFMVDRLIAEKKLMKMKVLFDHKVWSVPVDAVYKKGRINGPVLQFLLDEFKHFYSKI